MKKLSIITINLNNAEGLCQTIESVVFQTCTDYEYIVIDGASNDESVNVIKQFEDRITFWISEPDSGIYNAMNKGILNATGKYCLFLNSGDCLASNDVLANFTNSKLDADIIVGDLLIKENANAINLIKKISPDYITARYLFQDYLPHPSSFIKRDLFRTVGFYSEEFKIVSDSEFFMKALLIHKAIYAKLSLCVSVFTNDGISSKSEFSDIIDKEIECVKSIHFPSFIEDYKKLLELETEKEIFENSLDFKIISIFKKLGIIHLLTISIKICTKIKRYFRK